MATYAKRDELLLRLGFASYADYLTSVLWAEIREAVLDRDNRQCRICDRKARAVHHIDYSEATMIGDSLESLVSVCHNCHKKIEFNEEGKKHTLFQARKMYHRLCNKTFSKPRIRTKKQQIGYLIGMAHKKFHTARRKLAGIGRE